MIREIGTVYCIKDYRELYVCNFFKEKTYNVINSNDFTLSIVDNEGKTLRFNKNSPFNKYTVSNYFISLKEHRKIKLQKIYENR